MMLAPIIVFAFNRLESLKNTIDSVLRNPEASESELFVFVDGARENVTGEKEKVSKVCDYVRSISGFKTVHYCFSDKNNGLGPSIISGVTEIIEKYERVIVLEDDLTVARGFLSFMNTMLDAYETDSRIMQVTGFSTKHFIPADYSLDVYLNRRGESWSWGTWKDRWKTIDWNVSDYSSLLNDRRRRRQFNGIGSDLFAMLKDYMEGKNKSWAIRLCYSMFVQGKYTLCPVLSLVINYGFDDSATNCNGSFNRYKIEFNDTQLSFKPEPNVRYNRRIDKSANRFWTLRYRVFGKLMWFVNVLRHAR